ncbi:PEP-CTERM sorting domain-containing protein [Salipiger mangrovisoli]|uniref:PEP-CTERM sorting domain-containing protein n=1 Tax=Salipiger mangrovisoli TaxID=2865933 RepID=A0ABR9XA88_9RHOB|nr:PEP-CTERM sorting domain-containing protein [Salipiger mangrovisoli]MBE9640428.1 PEP-CTERM sorting domain-containing protein [Salipiger mangrovisoli]
MLRTLLLGAVLLSAPAAHASTTIDFGPASAYGHGPLIEFNDLVTPTTTLSDATFTFTVMGDLGAWYENVDVTVDNFSLGTALNNNIFDDVFDFFWDIGADFYTLTGTATIGMADFAPLISDGLLDVVFDFSHFVDDGIFGIPAVKTLYGSISFEEGPAPVPLPATGLLLGMALMGAGWARRRSAG